MYLGIDYGTEMIKVAGTPSLQDVPSLLQMTPEDPFLPCSAALLSLPTGVPEVQVWSIGPADSWAAYRGRFRDDCAMHAFRDAIDDTTRRLVKRDIPVRRERVLSDFVKSCRRGQFGEGEQFVWTVPDHWNHGNWTLGQAFGGAPPVMLIREWQAVCAIQDRLCGDTAIFVSMGAGPARFTVCGIVDGTWRMLTSVCDDRISGDKLKLKLVNWLAEEMIQEFRIDPREDLEGNFALRGAADRFFVDLAHCEQATLVASILGKELQRTLDHSQLNAWAADFRLSVSETVDRLAKNYHGEARDIVLWGELVGLLPVSEWVIRNCQSGAQPILGALDCVAAGAARLCAAANEVDSFNDSTYFAGVSPTDGRFVADLAVFGENEAVIPVLQNLPVELAAGRIPKTGALIRVDSGGSGERRAIKPQLMIGRNPEAAWTFSSDEFPEISFEHCVVMRRKADYIIKDLESTNGTYVNGNKASVHKLADGDQIQLGERGPRFRFESR